MIAVAAPHTTENAGTANAVGPTSKSSECASNNAMPTSIIATAITDEMTHAERFESLGSLIESNSPTMNPALKKNIAGARYAMPKNLT